ncbi:hypothetical protein CB1_018820001 [Camelus ferus]|nr:hypothetical protein CB1_018820001 [Camelus ferus]
MYQHLVLSFRGPRLRPHPAPQSHLKRNSTVNQKYEVQKAVCSEFRECAFKPRDATRHAGSPAASTDLLEQNGSRGKTTDANPDQLQKYQMILIFQIREKGVKTLRINLSAGERNHDRGHSHRDYRCEVSVVRAAGSEAPDDTAGDKEEPE